MPGLLNWIRASRQRKRERWEADHGHLSEQEKFGSMSTNRAGSPRTQLKALTSKAGGSLGTNRDPEGVRHGNEARMQVGPP